MARSTLLKFENKNYQKWVDNFKKVNDIVHDKDLAKELGLNPSGYNHYKRTNKFPYEKFVEASIKKNISLDKLLGIEVKHKESFEQKSDSCNEIPIVKTNNTYIVLPMIQQNNQCSLKAFIQDSLIFIIDSSINNYSSKSRYLLEKEGVYYLRCVDATIVGSFKLSNITFAASEENKIELSSEEFREFNIVGRVEKIISIEVKYL